MRWFKITKMFGLVGDMEGMYMEAENTKKKQQRKFAEAKNRIAKVNQTTMISLTFIELLLVLALVIQTFAVKTAFGKLGIFPLIVLIVGVVVNWVVYKRNKGSTKLKYIMLSTFFVGWFFLMVAGTNEMVSFYIYPLVIATILYYDKKYEKMTFFMVFGTTILRYIVWGAKGLLFGGSNTYFISLVVHTEIILVIHIIAKLSNKFSDDMLFSVKDEQDIQNEMLNDVLSISKEVQKGVVETNELIENVQNDSAVVHSAIADISDRTQKTVESVQEQTKMTKSISEDIEETAQNAKIMVEAATSSAELLDKNMKIVDSIRNDAVLMNETNSKVAVSMEELQKKAKEVQEITEVIFNISSQTNLLALNASIESARAGEAGRGFSVVADQIRNLSEETRQSTERIANIVEELNKNAREAAEIVQSSINAMNQQNEKVAEASDGLGFVQKNISTLNQRVEDINAKIENLVHSNDTIIENINQLSDSSEAVSESAKDVENRSLQNQKETEEAKKLLNEVNELVQQLEKYRK